MAQDWDDITGDPPNAERCVVTQVQVEGLSSEGENGLYYRLHADPDAPVWNPTLFVRDALAHATGCLEVKARVYMEPVNEQTAITLIAESHHYVPCDGFGF